MKSGRREVTTRCLLTEAGAAQALKELHTQVAPEEPRRLVEASRGAVVDADCRWVISCQGSCAVEKPQIAEVPCTGKI